MGESKRKRMVALAMAGVGGDQAQVVDTLGGRMHVRWDAGAAATPHGQLMYFAEFMAANGVFERWVSQRPLEYRSGNAPDKRNVLGPLMMGMLAEHRRYAHITAQRGDAVAAQALGMNKVVSEDALRRALVHIDATIKPLYQTYLRRLRQKANVQRLVAQQFARADWSRANQQGGHMVEDPLQLHGWSRQRRVVIVRQRIRGGIARERRVDGRQLKLDLAGPSVHEGDRPWEYAVTLHRLTNINDVAQITLTRGQYAPLLHRSSRVPLFTLPHSARQRRMFLRNDLRRGRADYFANPLCRRHWF